MSINIPQRRHVNILNTYADLNAPRIIAKHNPIRGLFQLSLTDSLSVTFPRRWEILIDGGYAYVGDGAKYFPILTVGTSTNIVTITPTVVGYEYDIVDAFGNTYHLIFNGARDFNPTIERTAGAALTGPVTLKSMLISYDDTQ